MSSSLLTINNITFEIPPERIQIVKDDYNTGAFSLRSQIATKVKSGKRDIVVFVDLRFATGINYLSKREQTVTSWINSQLAPLLIQIRKNPFVYVENEKIEKETRASLGNNIGEGSSLAFAVNGVDIQFDSQSPEMISVRLTMSYFNYYPYSSNFYYKELSPNGASIPSKKPGRLFDEYVKNGTYLDGRYINEIKETLSDDMEIFFKEYLPEEKLYTSLGDTDSETKLWKQGWSVDRDNSGNAYAYRYRRILVPKTHTIKSSALLLRSLAASIKMNIAKIPLQGHTTPTFQFLGGSTTDLNLSFFANAKLDGEKPVETSEELELLNNALETVNRNSVVYRDKEKSSNIYIRHPLISILKYKIYSDTTKETYVDMGNNTSGIFDPNECLSCMIEGQESTTIPGLPFCSNFNVKLSESLVSSNPTLGVEGKGSVSELNNSILSAMKICSDRYNIKMNGKSVQYSKAKDNYPDQLDAKALGTALMNTSPLGIGTIDEAIEQGIFEKSRDWVESQLEELSTERINLSNRTLLCREFANSFGQDLLFRSIKTENKTGKENPYTCCSSDIKQYNYVVDDSCYPDLLLPKNDSGKYEQPDYYYYNQDDEYKEDVNSAQNSISKKYQEVFDNYYNSVISDTAKLKPTSQMQISPLMTPFASNEAAAKKDTDLGNMLVQMPLDPNQQNFVLRSSIENFTDTTYTMRRSMPTFKLYFMEPATSTSILSFGDMHSRRLKGQSSLWKSFADFYDLNSIVDIRMPVPEDGPAPTLIIRMTNTSDDILGSYYSDKTKTIDELNKKEEDKKKEVNSDPRDGLIFTEGTKVQLRLGYDVNPNKLSVEFSGRVVKVGGGDVIEIVCVGDGIELVQELKGVGVEEEYTFSGKNTTKIIGDLLLGAEELKNFGRKEKNVLGNVAPFTGNFLGYDSSPMMDNIFAPSIKDVGSKEWVSSTVGSFAKGIGLGTTASLVAGAIGVAVGLTATPILLIGGAAVAAGMIKDYIKGSRFVIYEQTIWDVLQELTLRHPGTICRVVPYDNRSTLFFGYPDQLYFYRGINYLSAINDNNGTLYEDTNRQIFENLYGDMSDRRSKKSLKTDSSEGDITNIKDCIKPFRNYHLVTSEHDIVLNEIMTNTDDVYNNIEVVHPDTGSNINADGSEGFSSYEKSGDIKADDDLNKNFIKKKTVLYHNAHKDYDPYMPQKYAVSTLCNSLKKAYTGKLVILGRSNIKPEDVVFIYDNYNGIYGSIKAGDVVQTLTPEKGWLTEITPRMIVFPSEATEGMLIKAIEKHIASVFIRNNLRFYSTFASQREFDIRYNQGNDQVLPGALTGALSGTSSALSTASTLANVAILGAGVKAAAPYFAGMSTAGGTLSKVLLTTASAAVPALKGMAGMVGKVAGIFGADFIASYVSGPITNWCEFRQPIGFMPLIRKGKPWYTGLYGFRNNTAMDAVSTFGKEILGDVKAITNFISDEFLPDLVSKEDKERYIVNDIKDKEKIRDAAWNEVVKKNKKVTSADIVNELSNGVELNSALEKVMNEYNR